MAVFLVVYLAAVVVCLLGPEQQLRELQSVAWLLGPPASLVHGREYLWAVATGTGCTIIPLFWAARGRTAASRWVGVALTVLTWCLAGLLVYAPGA